MSINFLKLSACSLDGVCFDLEETKKGINKAIKKQKSKYPHAIIFPKDALFPKGCGELVSLYVDKGDDALKEIAMDNRDYDGLIFIGTKKSLGGKIYSLISCLYKGAILGYVSSYEDFEELRGAEKVFSPETVFEIAGARACVLTCEARQRSYLIPKLASETSCDIILMPCLEGFNADSSEHEKELLRAFSRELGVGLVAINGGIGEYSSPKLYVGSVAVFQNGSTVSYQRSCLEPICRFIELDRQSLSPFGHPKGFKFREADFRIKFKEEYSSSNGKELLAQDLGFSPRLRHTREKFLSELSFGQANAIAVMLKNSRVSKVVIGVSGGLDSTIAMLASKRALDILGLPARNLIAVTLPANASSDRTLANALTLINSLGSTHINIPIEARVLAHLEDIGASRDKKDATYENAFARERTQILFDISNKEGAIVIGTGDLSESALGFCTFGGDHMAGFNANISLPKSVMRQMLMDRDKIGLLPKVRMKEELDLALDDILATPISPELVGDGRAITQKTEEIVGPFELIDFFIFCLVGHKMSRERILFYAKANFEGRFDEAYIENRLDDFLKRFFMAQFKRECSPSACALMSIGLSPRELSLFPSISPEPLINSNKNKINYL